MSFFFVHLSFYRLNQSLFRLDLTAGAPPDMFSADGQEWGLPLYNWDAMEKDNYTWWRVNNYSTTIYLPTCLPI